MTTLKGLPDFEYKRTWRGELLPSDLPRELGEVYDSYSAYKERAMNYCRRLYEQYEGFNFGIISHNCMVFSVGFNLINPVTGELMQVKITRDHNYIMSVRG